MFKRVTDRQDELKSRDMSNVSAADIAHLKAMNEHHNQYVLPVLDCHQKLITYINGRLTDPRVKMETDNPYDDGQYCGLLQELDNLQNGDGGSIVSNPHTSISTWELIHLLDLGQIVCDGTITNNDPQLLNEYFLDCVKRKEPMLDVLRLLCLLAWTSNGLLKAHQKQHKQVLIQAYGYPAWQLVRNLEEAGMLAYTR